MIAGPLIVPDSTLNALLGGQLPPFPGANLTALLLGATYSPDFALHATLSDVSPHEISGHDYRRLVVTGTSVTAAPGGAVFATDAISWGDPVTMPPCKYLAVCFGSLGTLQGAERLLGIADLAPTHAAVEAMRSAFTVTPPAPGWFVLENAN